MYKKDPYKAAEGCHAIAVMTGWDLDKTLDYERIYQGMVMADFFFNRRNIMDRTRRFDIGFKGFSTGKAALTYH